MKIPNNIIVTWKDSNIPSYVIPNIKKLNPEKKILFFTDEDVVRFLSEEYDSSYVDFFHGIKRGCNKGDFFRYCYLYKRGGYYSDIDVKHREPIKNYISSDIDFFSVLSMGQGHIFQALLYCVSGHPVIKRCIKDMMSEQAQLDIILNTTSDMYKNVSKFIGRKKLVPGTTYKWGNTPTRPDGQNIRLAKEVKLDGEWACVYMNTIIAMSRYPNYDQKSGFLSFEGVSPEHQWYANKYKGIFKVE